MANFTLAEISGALSRVLSVAPDSAVIGRFAGQLEHTINSRPDFRRSGLGGSGFQTLVLSHLPPEVAALMNPSKLQELQRQQDRSNAPVAETTAYGKFAAFARGMASAQDGSERTASSASYGRELLTGDMAKARDLALSSGLGWVANNPDLLRLGPSAVQALADVQLKQESYQRFKNIGLEPRTIVDGARYFKRNGGDMNEASKAVEEVHKHLTPEEKKQHLEAVQRVFKSKPEEQDAAIEHHKKIMDGFKAKHPEGRAAFEKEQQSLQKQQRLEAMTAKATEDKVVRANTAETKVDDGRAKLEEMLKRRQAAPSAASAPSPK